MKIKFTNKCLYDNSFAYDEIDSYTLDEERYFEKEMLYSAEGKTNQQYEDICGEIQQTVVNSVKLNGADVTPNFNGCLHIDHAGTKTFFRIQCGPRILIPTG